MVQVGTEQNERPRD